MTALRAAGGLLTALSDGLAWTAPALATIALLYATAPHITVLT